VSIELSRHVNGLVADLAAEHGEIDLVGRRVECSPEAYEAVCESFDAFGVVGGAGIEVTEGDEALLVRYEEADGWIDPGTGRRPGESYRECAKRGLREATGIEASIDGLAQLHVLYMDDPTGRDPVPNPYLSFRGTRESGTVSPGPGVETARWVDEASAELDLVYEELTERPLDG
jgi:ADP-ribose pyrophosphatase YjhB (NUDIX family)